MDRPLSAIMERHDAAVAIEDTVETLERVLSSTRLSCVPVVDVTGESFGIVTAADVALFRLQKKNAKAVRAWEMCAYQAVKTSPDVMVREAARLMVAKGLHHIVVASEERMVLGVVSSLDIIAELLRQIGEPKAERQD